MLLKVCLLFWCWQSVLASADDDKKDKFDIGVPKEIIPEHVIEVAAAHQVRELVLDVVKKVRETLKEPIYFCDEKIEGFQGYNFDEDDDFRIDRGLLFCVSQNNTPGTIYTRWGVWRFTQHRASLEYDASKFGLWSAICDKIITHKNIVLKPYGRATSLGGERMYIIKKVGDITLADPFEATKKPNQQISCLQAMAAGITKCVSMPTSAVRSALSKGFKKTQAIKKQTRQAAIKPYHPSNRYDSLPYTALLRDSEIYWLQLCLIYRACKDIRLKEGEAKK